MSSVLIVTLIGLTKCRPVVLLERLRPRGPEIIPELFQNLGFEVVVVLARLLFCLEEGVDGVFLGLFRELETVCLPEVWKVGIRRFISDGSI